MQSQEMGKLSRKYFVIESKGDTTEQGLRQGIWESFDENGRLVGRTEYSPEVLEYRKRTAEDFFFGRETGTGKDTVYHKQHIVWNENYYYDKSGNIIYIERTDRDPYEEYILFGIQTKLEDIDSND